MQQLPDPWQKYITPNIALLISYLRYFVIDRCIPAAKCGIFRQKGYHAYPEKKKLECVEEESVTQHQQKSVSYIFIGLVRLQ